MDSFPKKYFSIFLILHYGANEKDLIYPLISVFITIFLKFFLEFKGSPIINPTVFGLLATEIITFVTPGLEPLFISWWGASFSYNNIPVALIISAVWILFFFKTWRKQFILLSFLISHAIILLIQNELAYLSFTFTDATIYFFASIMLIEPRTSPIIKKDQIIFGILAAMAYNVLRHFQIAHFDLIAIAIANIYFFISSKLFNRLNTR